MRFGDACNDELPLPPLLLASVLTWPSKQQVRMSVSNSLSMNFKAQISFGESETGRGALIKLRSIADHHRERRSLQLILITLAHGETRRGDKAINGKRCSWKRDKKSQLWHRERREGEGGTIRSNCLYFHTFWPANAL